MKLIGYNIHPATRSHTFYYQNNDGSYSSFTCPVEGSYGIFKLADKLPYISREKFELLLKAKEIIKA